MEIREAQAVAGCSVPTPTRNRNGLHLSQESGCPFPSSPTGVSQISQALINKLPQEIIAEIFAHYDCAYDSFELLPFEYSEGMWSGCEFIKGSGMIHNGPWRLGQVCRDWRQMVLGEATLWSRVCIHADPEYVNNIYPTPNYLLRSKPHLDFIVQEGIRRSQETPLSFDLVVSEEETLVHMLTPLLSTAFRWEDLRIISSRRAGGITLDELNIFEVLALPELKNIELGNISHHYVSDTEMMIKAPKLQTVTTRDIRDLFDVPLPWDQVTTLKCYDTYGSPHFTTVPPLTESFASCPGLRTFIGEYSWECPVPTDSPHTHHSSINTLSIRPPLWLKTVTAPNLHHLSSMIAYPGDGESPLSALMLELDQFIIRSQCPLVSLSLEIHDLDRDSLKQWEDIIQQLPTLSILELRFLIRMNLWDDGAGSNGEPTSMITSIGSTTFQSPPLPNLAELRIYTDVSAFCSSGNGGKVAFDTGLDMFREKLLPVVTTRIQGSITDSEKGTAFQFKPLSAFHFATRGILFDYLDAEQKMRLNSERRHWEALATENVKIVWLH